MLRDWARCRTALGAKKNQTNEGRIEDDRRSLEVFSSLDDSDCMMMNVTVKGLSDDGHSYAGTAGRGVLRGDSE